MNRNEEAKWAEMPTVDIERSKLNLTHTHTTTFNNGDIIPVFTHLDGTPGETYKMAMSWMVRLNTPIDPTADNMYMDIYWFKDRYNDCWEHWVNMHGENDDGAWVQETEYTVPQIKIETESPAPGTILNYMGLANAKNIEVSRIPLTSLTRIYNQWFRNQNYIAPYEVDYTDQTLDYDEEEPTRGGKCFKASRFADYFSKGLPAPQKGDAVTLPLGTTAPVIGNGTSLGLTDGTSFAGIRGDGSTGNVIANTPLYGLSVGTSGNNLGNLSNKVVGVTTDPTQSGLIVDLTEATAATVNALRLSFQVQKILEQDARSGTRYNEVLASHFGTNVNLAEIGRPEYLGGKRVLINIEQIEQTSSTDSQSPLGHTGGYSLTNDGDFMFTKSLTKHEMIFCLIVCRTERTYQQGVHKSWFRKRRLEWFYPKLKNLGEQPIRNKEIYVSGNKETDEQVFAFQEAWAEMRWKPNIITGMTNTGANTGMDTWHYGDWYANTPILSQEWLEEGVENVDRTIEIKSDVGHQLLGQFAFAWELTTPVPVHSIPGLVDHF